MSTSIIKNVTTTFVGLAVVFALAFSLTSQARAASNALSQSQIDAIVNLLVSFGADQATINNVKAALNGEATSGTTTGGSTGGSTTAMVFTMNHKMGDKGGEVMNIQKFLNKDPDTQVAATGAGSPGNETDYFGPATKAAVIKFQNKYASDILAPVGLTSGTGYWGSSTRAKANAIEAARAGSSTDTTGGTTNTTTGGATVAAAAQPANSLAPANAANVPFTRFTITAGASDVTVTGVKVKLQGLADKAAFSSVVLLDENGMPMGTTKTLNSNDEATVGGTFTVPANSSRTYTVAANMGSSLTSYAGQVASFAVVSVMTSDTVSGTLPIVGASHTINASLSIGTATAARGALDPNASATKEIGTTGYTFSSVKITAGSAEKIRVKSIRWNQSGSASASDLANVKVVVDGTEYPATVSSDGKYYTATFGNGIVIAEGLSKEFSVKGDIVSGTNRTVAFDIYKFTDIMVTGETYGYGITPSAGTGFSSSSPVYDANGVVTIAGGTVNSISKSSAAPAADIAEQKADELLGAFTVDMKGEPVTVGTLVLHANGTWAAADGDNITNVTLVDQNGNVLAGPVDGVAADTFTFTSVSFPTGVTTVYVKGMLGSAFANGDTLYLTTTPSTDWSDVTGDVTGDTVTMPSSTVTMNTMTVRSATLTGTTLTQPVARSVVKGAQDFTFAKLSFSAANSGEDVRVTAIGVTDTTASGAKAANIDNVELWADLDGDGTFETKVATAQQFDETTANTADTITFTLDTPFVVSKNGTVVVEVRGDVSSAAVTSGTHTVDLSSVTATGETSGVSVSVTPSGSGQAMTIATSGTLTVSVDSSSPSAALLLDDTTGEQTLGVFRLAANNVEDLDVDSIKITDDGSATAGGSDVVAKYVFYNGSTKLGEVINNSGTAELFLSDGTLTVPADGYVLVTVKGVMNNIDGTAVQNGDAVEVTIAAAGDVDTTGKDSGVAVDSTQTSVDAATHLVYEAYPTVAFDNSGVGTSVALNAQQLVAKIKITNNGDKDITLNQADGNNLSLQVQIVGDDTDLAAETITIKDENGNTLDTDTTSINSASGTTQVDFDMSSYAAGITVPAGGSQTIYVYFDTTDLEDTGNMVQIWLDDTAADLGFGVESTGDYSVGDKVFKNDIYGPSITKD